MAKARRIRPAPARRSPARCNAGYHHRGHLCPSRRARARGGRRGGRDGGWQGGERRPRVVELEEVADDRAQRVERGGGIDRRAQVRAAVDALRVPGTEGAQLVDDPPLPARRAPALRPDLPVQPRGMAEALPFDLGRLRSAAGRCRRGGTGRAAAGTPAAGRRRPRRPAPGRRSTGCGAHRGPRAPPATAVSRIRPTRSLGVTQSPLPNTGIDTRRATSSISDQSERPV